MKGTDRLILDEQAASRPGSLKKRQLSHASVWSNDNCRIDGSCEIATTDLVAVHIYSSFCRPPARHVDSNIQLQRFEPNRTHLGKSTVLRADIIASAGLDANFDTIVRRQCTIIRT